MAESRQFVVDSEADRQPVERLQERKSMVTFPSLEDKHRSAVLCTSFFKIVFQDCIGDQPERRESWSSRKIN